MLIEVAQAKEAAVVSEYLDNISGERRTVKTRDLITEDPLMSREKPHILVFLENDLIFHIDDSRQK